jgi:DNA-binding CsgD family transcriptional regulator
VRLAEYLYEVGDDTAALAAMQRAVDIVPAQPPTPELAYALASLAGGLMMARRHPESVPIAERALVLAQATGAGAAEVRARTVLAGDSAYLGGGEDAIAQFRRALRLAADIGDHWGLDRVYVNFTDALIMLGRPQEAAELGREGTDVLQRYGIYSPLVVSNRVEALLAVGAWEEAEAVSATALRRLAASFQDALFVLCAELELGRGRFDAAHAHLDAAHACAPRGRALATYCSCLAELTLWERRWRQAQQAVDEGLQHTRVPDDAETRSRLCAQGLRAQAELAARARAHRDDNAVAAASIRAAGLIEQARQATAGAVTPNATGWLALADAEYARATGIDTPALWSFAAARWDRLARQPLVGYCRWRQAEALVAAGAPRTESTAPLRSAHAIAARLGALPLIREIESLGERARLDPTPASTIPPEHADALHELGLTPRETEVLALIANGRTNQEIAAELVISIKTAGVHVSHILHKLGAANRMQAGAIAHRLTAP